MGYTFITERGKAVKTAYCMKIVLTVALRMHTPSVVYPSDVGQTLETLNNLGQKIT
jgi:hypothetical protein